jgi:anti-sigma B factor antagonist
MFRPPAAFSATATRHGDAVVIALTGELDVATAPQLERAVPPLRPGDTLVIDLRGLDFMDSSGLHELMRLDVASRADGWSLAVVRGGPGVQRILDLVRLEERVRIVDAPGEIAAGLG